MTENVVEYTFFNRYELDRIIGTRAKQLEGGAKPMVDTTDLRCPIEIARKELKERVLPLNIVRKLPNGSIHEKSVINLKTK